MGTTPRSVKRFANLYQLMKILRRGQDPNRQLRPTDEELTAFVLALAEGLPEFRRALTIRAERSKTIKRVLVVP